MRKVVWFFVALFALIAMAQPALASVKPHADRQSVISVETLKQYSAIDKAKTSAQLQHLAFLRGGNVGPPPPSGITTFTALHTYFIAPSGCNDSNAGTSVGTQWCTLNTGTNAHALVCGDVVIAATGAYSPMVVNMQPTGCSPSGSSSGGIDGTGGIFAVILLCGGNVGTCTIDATGSGDSGGLSLQANYWSAQGWFISSAGNSAGFGHDCATGGTTPRHHLTSINNISSSNTVGFNFGVCGGTASVDYVGVVGVLAQNSNTHSACVSAINIVTPRELDTTAGTHIFVGGNFALSNPGNAGCVSDGNGIILDSPDILNYSQQAIFSHNIVYKSRQYGIHIFSQETSNANPIVKVYNNTTYGNGNPIIAGSSTVEEITQWNNKFRQSTYLNIARTDVATRSGANLYAFIATNVLGSGSNTVATIGGSGLENVFYGLFTGGCDGTSCAPGSTPWGGVSGTIQSLNSANNFYGTDPLYTNVADLSNWTGTPSCTAFENVAQCMGWNASTSTLTSLTPISDLTATCGSNCTGRGYQRPSTTCNTNADYPAFLKGLVALHWTGASVQQKQGSFTTPCGS